MRRIRSHRDSLFGMSDSLAIGFIIGVVQDSFDTALVHAVDTYRTIATDGYMKMKAGEALVKS